MPTETYRCAYCGSQQTWDGQGVRTCSHCGAAQPEQPVADDAPAPKSSHKLLFLVAGLLLAGIAYLVYAHSSSPAQVQHLAPIVNGPPPASQSRIERVLNPVVRVVPAGSDLSLLDLLRSAPNSTAAMFDTRLLTVSQPRAMNDIDGHLFFVGEVVNHSPDTTAIAPVVGLTLYKGSRKLESTDLEFSDLPPGGHSPAYFTWAGSPGDLNHFEFHWKPVQAYAQGQPHHPRLETTITTRKLTPSSLTVNFGPVFHYVVAEVHGTVTNRGDALAQGIQLYLTLRDARGRITGFKEQDLQQLGPGQTVEYTIEADQWDDPVASLEASALAVTQPDL